MRREKLWVEIRMRDLRIYLSLLDSIEEKFQYVIRCISSLIPARREIIVWCKFSANFTNKKCSGDVEKICDKITWAEYVLNINRITNIDWSLSKAIALRNAATRRIIVVNDVDKFVNRTSFLFVARKMKIMNRFDESQSSSIKLIIAFLPATEEASYKRTSLPSENIDVCCAKKFSKLYSRRRDYVECDLFCCYHRYHLHV